MNILAIETSCDETAVSVVRAGGGLDDFSFEVLGNSLLSQVELHKEYGGVFPALAKREHAKNLVPLLGKTLSEAKLLLPSDTPLLSQEQIGELKELLSREPELFVQFATVLAKIQKPDIDAIAVTAGPGLEPALWVGINFARALSKIWSVPLVPINHMEGHIVACLIAHHEITPIQFPALALLISGGHTELVKMNEWFSYELIGRTRDDAVGEAFDKVARMLNLPYPGGPEISRLAECAREENLEQPFTLPRPMIDTDDFDFSFSGLKTSVLYLLRETGKLSETQRKQLAREFEDVVTEVLITKTRHVLEENDIKTLIIGGGVSANTHLRDAFTTLIENYPNTTLFLSPEDLTGDNAIMIAAAGALRLQSGQAQPDTDIAANGNLSLA
jgi:N6-L-threonylcarbamoyladenine synthase